MQIYIARQSETRSRGHRGHQGLPHKTHIKTVITHGKKNKTDNDEDSKSEHM